MNAWEAMKPRPPVGPLGTEWIRPSWRGDAVTYELPSYDPATDTYALSPEELGDLLSALGYVPE